MPDKCCMFLNRSDYDEAARELSIFVGDFQFENEVKPFMLNYREYMLYVFDSTGMTPAEISQNVTTVADTARAWSTRVFAIWTTPAWSHLVSIDRYASNLPNVVFCDSPNWVEDLTTAIRHCKRIRHERESDPGPDLD